MIRFLTLRNIVVGVLAAAGLGIPLACEGPRVTDADARSIVLSSEDPGQDSAPNPTPAPPPVVQPPIVGVGEAFAMSQLQGTMSVDLNKSLQSKITISASASFSGDVDLSVERDQLNLADNKSAVGISISPNKVTLAPGQSVDLTLNVAVGLQAPDFNDHFSIVAKQSGGAATASSSIAFKVNPLLDIEFRGGAIPEVFVPDIKGLDFKPFAAGVMLRFINMDTTKTLIVHGNGAIPHQNVNQPLAAATATAPGGVYVVNMTKTTANLTASFYDHIRESGGNARAIRFNVQ